LQRVSHRVGGAVQRERRRCRNEAAHTTFSHYCVSLLSRSKTQQDG
jgi:hypothetical protein